MQPASAAHGWIEARLVDVGVGVGVAVVTCNVELVAREIMTGPRADLRTNTSPILKEHWCFLLPNNDCPVRFRHAKPCMTFETFVSASPSTVGKAKTPPSTMDQGRGQQRSNIARLSKLPLARASTIPTSIHQDEPSKQSRPSNLTTTHTTKPSLRPLGESNSASIKPSFGWTNRFDRGIISPRSISPPKEYGSLNTTPPSKRADVAIVEEGDENGTNQRLEKIDDATIREKRRPRPSLSERTIETLSNVPPSPSPTRRRSSTVKSGGSMGPPPRPASAMKASRPTTPSTPSSGRAPSPMKRPFRPPGKPATPGKDNPPLVSTMDNIYTPPRAFVRDHASRIGRPARDNRRSISTNIKTNHDDKPALKPTHSAVKVKSMYDLRAAASRGLSSKPSLPTLSKDSATPRTITRKASYHETSPQTGLLKARSPGENIIATTGRPPTTASKTSVPVKKAIKRTPTPNQSGKKETTATNSPKSSTTLRDTIAKAKAARKEELRKSEVGLPNTELDSEIIPFEPVIVLGSNSLKKKLELAVTTGSLNLSAMALKAMPEEVLTMYDYKEDSGIAWSETVDLKKLLLADNEIETLSDAAFPDWSQEEMMADPDKSNQFGGLETLDIHGNLLKTVPVGFRQLSQLKVLNLNGNHLTPEAFSIILELGNLRELRAAKNGLSGNSIANVSTLKELQILDLSDNQLDTIPSGISELQNLQRLLLGGNRLNSVSMVDISSQSLVELDVSRNMLTDSFADERLRQFQKLQTLDVSVNSLKSICYGKLELPCLQNLTARNNRLSELPDLSACAQLTTLVACGNSLTALPHGFASLENLRNVDLSGNSIKHVGTEVATMTSLVAFNLAGNPLREKKYLTMNADEIKMDLQKKSAPIDDSKSDLRQDPVAKESHFSQEVVSTEPSLFKTKGGVLDLSSKNLSSISPSQVDLGEHVHTIRLANNDLTAFPIELLMHPMIRWNLRSLDMSHNPGIHPTDYLQDELHLPRLQSLYVVSTGLTTLDTLTTYLKAPELKELNISCHRLTGHIPWVRAWYPSLTTLLASDNWFESIDVEAVRGLEILDFRNNEIDHLPPRIGLLGNHANKNENGRLRSFECSGNRFRVPRLRVIERGTDAILKDLRRMVPAGEVPEEWINEV